MNSPQVPFCVTRSSRWIWFFILSSLSYCCSHPKEAAPTFPFLAKPDSIIQKSEVGLVYMSRDTSSPIYDWLVPKSHQVIPPTLGTTYLDHIRKEHQIAIQSFATGNFPKAWNSVFLHDGQFYVYAPSDWMSNSGYYISDSVIYITRSDPGDIYPIVSLAFPKEDSAIFQVINYQGHRLTIRMNVYDADLGIFIWTFIDSSGTIKHKELLQDSRFVKKLPAIVSDCGDQKCFQEFTFDTIPFTRFEGEVP